MKEGTAALTRTQSTWRSLSASKTKMTMTKMRKAAMTTWVSTMCLTFQARTVRRESLSNQMVNRRWRYLTITRLLMPRRTSSRRETLNAVLSSELPVCSPALTVQTVPPAGRNIPWEPRCRTWRERRNKWVKQISGWTLISQLTACWPACLSSWRRYQHWPAPARSSASVDPTSI